MWRNHAPPFTAVRKCPRSSCGPYCETLVAPGPQVSDLEECCCCSLPLLKTDLLAQARKESPNGGEHMHAFWEMYSGSSYCMDLLRQP
jgi:hypothetical protein